MFMKYCLRICLRLWPHTGCANGVSHSISFSFYPRTELQFWNFLHSQICSYLLLLPCPTKSTLAASRLFALYIQLSADQITSVTQEKARQKEYQPSSSSKENMAMETGLAEMPSGHKQPSMCMFIHLEVYSFIHTPFPLCVSLTLLPSAT